MREKLAALCHEQWSDWMKHLFSKCHAHVYNKEEVVIPRWAIDRWKRQMNTPYKDLSEEEKESDRREADKFLEILRKAPWDFFGGDE